MEYFNNVLFDMLSNLNVPSFYIPMPGATVARVDTVIVRSAGGARQEYGVEDCQSRTCVVDIWDHGEIQLRRHS